MGDWYQNGRAIQAISVESRGLHYGDGLFETIAIRQGTARNWPLHMSRLKDGCAVLGFEAPNQDSLLNDVLESLQKSTLGREYCLVKIIVTAEEGNRGYGREVDTKTDCLIGIFSAEPFDQQVYRNGVDVIRCRTTLAMRSPLAGLKTLNRLEQVLARSEVLQEEAFEGLTLDDNENVLSGTMSNVFFIQQNDVLTPDLTQAGIRGTMRAFIIGALQEELMAVSERTIKECEITSMDEAFLCNSQFGVIPISAYNGHAFRTQKKTTEIMAIVAGLGVQECQR